MEERRSPPSNLKKQIIMEELTGTVVLVHPELMNDPVNRQGHVGIVATADLGQDEVFVGFGKGPLGLYSVDALLVLKPHNEIYKDLLNHVQELDAQDFKAMLRISMLLEAGSPKQIKDALELAMTSYQTLSHSTIPLQDKLNPIREQIQTEERDFVHAR